MIERFLDKLDSPRRHLTVLVGLLLTTFVLTAALAWQAQQSERAKQFATQETLKEIARTGVSAWSTRFAEMVGNSIPARDNPAFWAVYRNRDLPLAEFVASNDISGLCTECRPPARGIGYFTVEIATGAVEREGEARAAVVAQVLEHVRRQHYAIPLDGMAFALHAVDDAVTPTVLSYIRLNEAGLPHRVYGVVLAPTLLPQLLSYSLAQARIYPKSAVYGLSNDSLVATRMLAGSTLAYSSGDAGSATVVSDSVNGPIWGARFEANVRPAAAEILFPTGAATAKWALIVTLIALITLLFAGSILLVRREAELVRLRADFIASASHELRTPLAQIRMFTETLLLGRVRSDLERRRSLEIVDQEARRLSQLVENLLQFSQNEGGRNTRIAPEPTMFATEIRAAIDSFAPLLRKHGAELRAELQESVSAPVDRSALRQILVNLLDNALKYGPAGQRLTVGLALFDDAARVWVDDEGPGIPPDAREQVFESFYRMRRDVDARITGSGIGLAVVRQLSRLHDGGAWAEDAPGGGARIVVEFPGAYLRAETASDLAAAS